VKQSTAEKRKRQLGRLKYKTLHRNGNSGTRCNEKSRLLGGQRRETLEKSFVKGEELDEGEKRGVWLTAEAASAVEQERSRKTLGRVA